jgi:hypothetical protein
MVLPGSKSAIHEILGTLSFWGRGMATTWRVTIEAEEMTRRQVDLSGLTAIDIEIGYHAFL